MDNQIAWRWVRCSTSQEGRLKKPYRGLCRRMNRQVKPRLHLHRNQPNLLRLGKPVWASIVWGLAIWKLSVSCSAFRPRQLSLSGWRLVETGGEEFMFRN
jgi:hypothetical protein